jgi:hypothetical protein
VHPHLQLLLPQSPHLPKFPLPLHPQLKYLQQLLLLPRPLLLSHLLRKNLLSLLLLQHPQRLLFP